MKKAISLLLAFSLILSLFACGKEPVSDNIQETVSETHKEVIESIAEILTTIVAPSTVPESTTSLRCLETKEFAPSLAYCTADFGIRLFNEVHSEQKNPLISPLSVVSASLWQVLAHKAKLLNKSPIFLNMTPKSLRFIFGVI